MSVHQLKVAAALGALVAFSAAGYADDVADQANPDSRALLEYVKKLESRVNELEREREWPLESVRAQSGSALESAVRAINLSGYMEFQYGYNFRHGGGNMPSGSTTPPTNGGGDEYPEEYAKALSYTGAYAYRGDTLRYNQLRGTDQNDNGFTMQNVQILADKPLAAVGSTGFRVRAEYGLVAEADSYGFGNAESTVPGSASTEYTGNGSSFHLREAYFNWRANTGGLDFVDFTLGKFDTPLGFETPDNTDNWLVTRNMLYVWGTPRTHTGVKATLPWSDCMKTNLYFVNGWDVVTDDADGKTFILSQDFGNFEFANSKITANISYGNEGSIPVPSNYGQSQFPPDGNKTKFFEAIWRGEFTPETAFAVDGFWATQDMGALDASASEGRESHNWHGVYGYVKHQASKEMFVSGRVGWYSDSLPEGPDLRVIDFSVALGYNFAPDATVMLEYRHDWAHSGAEPYFDSDGDPFGNQDTLTASFVYRF